MKAGIALAAILILVACVTFALYHALRWLAALRAPGQVAAPDDAATRALQDERRRVLQTLREARADFETGKLDAADYERMRARGEREALAVLDCIARHNTP
ncbi:MAG: hypothetical protein EXR79_14165 [Myxococcales bacterium]|nr:hypothetical protein [Myxococcales bacterium]